MTNKSKLGIDNDIEFSSSDTNTYIIDSVQSNVYKYNLDTTLEAPQDFRDLIKLLDTVTEYDTVVLRINTYGGDIYSMISIINSIKNSKAQVITEVAFASSAGSFIALSADDCVSLPFSEWFLHEMQSYNTGSTSSQVQSLEFRLKTQRHLMEEIYKGFLTDAEIKQLCEGKIRDWEMDYMEASVRLENWRLYKDQQLSNSEHVSNEVKKKDKKGV